MKYTQFLTVLLQDLSDTVYIYLVYYKGLNEKLAFTMRTYYSNVK